MTKNQEVHVRWLEDLDSAGVSHAGGKTASLGEIPQNPARWLEAGVVASPRGHFQAWPIQTS